MDITPVNIGAIDIGSNAMRLAISRVEKGQLSEIENIREPVRLGQNVFSKGAVGKEAMERTTDVFIKFRGLLDKHGVKRFRAVATSALREAANRDILIERIAEASGIHLEVIGGEEEARLVHLAVARKVNLKNKLAMLVDIGGGSVEVTLASNGAIVAAESFKMGAVRLLQELEEKKRGEKQFTQLVREYVDATRRRMKKELGNQTIDLCVGTGGNIESLGDLRQELFGKNGDAINADELETVLKKLQEMTYEERVCELKLRPDRADVIVPAAIILQKLVRLAGVNEVTIPHLGLKDGLLLDLAEELSGTAQRSHREQVLAGALQLGRKYNFEEQHGTTVAQLAMQLFDETRDLHKLDEEQRLLLEAAALLHEIGNFVSAGSHHKHSYYVVLNTPLIGLSEAQRAIVANVARYHRKAFPDLRHEPYRALSPKDRVIVSKLAALLRLADALDNEHGGKITRIKWELNKPNLFVSVEGDGDLLLEKWALMKKAGLFEEVFGVKVSLVD